MDIYTAWRNGKLKAYHDMMACFETAIELEIDEFGDLACPADGDSNNDLDYVLEWFRSLSGSYLDFVYYDWK